MTHGKHPDAEAAFGDLLRRLRRAAGHSQAELARQLPTDQSTLSRWETGRSAPDPDIAERLDVLLAAGGRLVRLLAPTSPGSPPVVGPAEPVTTDEVAELHAGIAHLVALDGHYGGADLVGMATRMFRTARARLEHCPPGLEAEASAATAELGELAGWLAFDDLQHERARGLSLEALHLARAAGDTGMELFVLGNLALLSTETGRPRDALRTVGLMQAHRLSPRLRIMTALRRARAGAELGDETAIRLIRRAQAAVDGSVQRSDPAWTWWLDRRELLVHEGGMWCALDRPGRAVDCYAAALDEVPDGYRWASYIGGATLVSALVRTRSWVEAEHAARDVAALAGQVTSARAQQRLRSAARTARQLRAPSSLQDLLDVLATR